MSLMGDNEVIHFRSYYIITRIEASIRNLTPLRVGAGKGYRIGEPDLPIVRTPDKRAVIPGSSLKGVFRNNLARFLNLDVEKDLSYAFGSGGDNPLGSSLLFSDFVTEKPVETVERAHIRIDLRTGGTQNLFQVEYVPENNVFKGLIIGRNIPLTDLSAMVSVITKLLNLGVVRVGGFKSRGYGIVNFDIDKIQVMLPSEELTYKTELGIKRRGAREIRIKVEGDKLVENGKGFLVKPVSDMQFFKVYEIDKNSFYSVGDEVLKTITTA